MRLLVIILSLWAGSAYAQYRNQVNETIGTEFTYCFDNQLSNMLSVGFVNDSNVTLYGWNYLSFKTYDEDYNVISNNLVTDSLYFYNGFYGFEFVNNHYYHCGLRTNALGSDTTKGFLIKYDTLGNIVWKKYYHEEYKDVRIGFMTSNDSLLFLFYNILHPSATELVKVMLTAIDTSGAILWEKSFVDRQQQASSIKQTSDHGFILTCWYDTVGPQGITTIAYKLDSVGNTEWSHIYRKSIKNNWLQMVEMPNGNILGYGYSGTASILNRAWLVEIDATNGSIIQDTVFLFNPYYSVFGSYSDIIFHDDEIILVGGSKDYAGLPNKIIITSINYDFEINWLQSYYVRESQNAIFNLFEKDGFYHMQGLVLQDDTSNTNDEWFMVVDSMGCAVANCTLGVGELQEPANNSMLTIYPNPTYGSITIGMEEFSTAHRYQLIITDLLGKQVATIAATNPTVSFNFSNLDAGIYLVHLLEDGVSKQTVKVVYGK